MLVVKWGSFLILLGLGVYLLGSDLPIWLKLIGVSVITSLGGLALAQEAD